MEGKSSCYRGCHFNGGRNGHVTEVVTLMEVANSKGGRMVVTEVARGRIVMLQRWSV